jgi:hypothetical protein
MERTDSLRSRTDRRLPRRHRWGPESPPPPPRSWTDRAGQVRSHRSGLHQRHPGPAAAHDLAEGPSWKFRVRHRRGRRSRRRDLESQVLQVVHGPRCSAPAPAPGPFRSRSRSVNSVAEAPRILACTASAASPTVRPWRASRSRSKRIAISGVPCRRSSSTPVTPGRVRRSARTSLATWFSIGSSYPRTSTSRGALAVKSCGRSTRTCRPGRADRSSMRRARRPRARPPRSRRTRRVAA